MPKLTGLAASMTSTEIFDKGMVKGEWDAIAVSEADTPAAIPRNARLGINMRNG